jgi:pilus assembly protein Flp/PilA
MKKGGAAMLFAHASRRVHDSRSGQGLVEYALILVLVAIVVIAALLILGPVIGNSFSTVNNSLTSL